MDEGFDIPIGGDLSGFNQTISELMAVIGKLGDQIAAAMSQSNAALAGAQAHFGKLTTGAHGTATATTAASSSVARLTTHLVAAAKIGGSVGYTLNGIASGARVASTATKLLTGIDLVTKLQGWINNAGGVRAAFAKIPAAMGAILKNPAFQKIAAGAAVAVVGILAIRTAWRTAAGAAHILSDSAHRVFHGMVAAARATASTISSIFHSIGSMPGKLLSLPGLPLAGLLSAGAATALLVAELKGASADASVFEDMQVSVERFTGSVSVAKDLLAELSKFSLNTDFATSAVQLTAKGLLGDGVTEDVAQITKDLAAISSSGEQLQSFGDDLGKSFAKGKFQAADLQKFTQKGINLLPVLQSQLGLSGDAFEEAVRKGLTFQQVTTAIHAMSQEGGQFYGLLEKRSMTLSGLVTRLSSAWTQVRIAFGQPLNDAIKPILELALTNFKALQEQATKWGEKLGEAISVVFEAFKSGEIIALLKAGVNVAFQGGIDLFMRGLAGATAFLAKALPPIFEVALAKLSDPNFWKGIGFMLQGAAASFGATMQRALGREDLAKSLRRQSYLQNQAGTQFIGEAGGKDFGATLKKVIGEAGAASRDAFKSMPKSGDLTKAQSAFDQLVGKFQAWIAANRDFATTSETPNRTGAIVQPQDSLMDAVHKAVAPAVMSLTRIGGGGVSQAGFGNLVSEARKQSGFQKQMVDLLKAKPVLHATYA